MKRLATGIIVAVGILFFANELIDYLRGVAAHLGLGRLEAVITVQLPAVHTRERLMNDRFEEVAWLNEQLSYTINHGPEDLERSGPQNNPERSDKPAPPAVAAEQSKGSDAVPDKPAIIETRSISADVRAQPDRLNWFKGIDSYRDVLREERALAMLDDRHDMDSNELYFLSFDATVPAGARSNGFAAIEVVLAPNDKYLGPTSLVSNLPGGAYAQQHIDFLQNQDFIDIYFDWLERSQNFLVDRININQNLFNKNSKFIPGYDDPRVTLETLICVEWTLSHIGINREVHLPNTHEFELARWSRNGCRQWLRQAHTPGEQLTMMDKFAKEQVDEAKALSLLGLDPIFLERITDKAKYIARQLIIFEEHAFRDASSGTIWLGSTL